MGHPSGDKSEILFRRLLFLSLLTYFLLALVVEMIPSFTDVRRDTAKPPRVVQLIEVSSKGKELLSELDKKREREKRLAEERKRRLEEEKKRLEEKRLAEERKRQEKERRAAEEKKRSEEKNRQIEEQKRHEEERKVAEERRRTKEAKRLAKERNREIAMSSGLLKALKSEKRSIDKIVRNKEMQSVLSETDLKSIKAQQDTSNRQEPREKVLKGSEGIGDVTGTIAETKPSSLSGQKGDTGIEIRHISINGITPISDLSTRKMRSYESIKEVVTSRRGGLDFIYKKALRSNPILKGVVILEFTIAEDGDVTGIRIVSSTVNDLSFEKQILQRIRSWKFPPYPGSGNTVVTYPIKFSRM